MEKEEKKSVFDELNSVNINGHTEKKKGGDGKELTYLSWCWAWAEIKKRYPDAQYEIEKFNGLPYVFDPNTGYMVYTKVTIEGVTHEMWLPVMDSSNKAMKAEPYQVQTKYKTFTVNSATMYDVNKAIMRCLVKNLAMHGLGLYIYAGEDLPEVEAEEVKEQQQALNTQQSIDLAAALDTVKGCSTVDEVIAVWNELTAWQSNPTFKATCTKRKNEILSKQQ